jgi:Transglycosylase SLT domain/SPOR domain
MRSLTQTFIVATLIVANAAWFAYAGDDPETAPGETVDQALCRTIETSAAANGLPAGFFTRLIWQESSLRANATSPAGAQGIAQFMPGTAAERGLTNPFDPEKAIPEAAKFLAELSQRFGNLGLAAAAYNAGPNLIASVLAGQSEAPLETRAYVFAITARPLEAWAKPPPAPPAPPAAAPAPVETCQQIVEAMRRIAPAETLGATPFAPWGVQLAGNFSKSLALAAFARTRRAYASVIGDTQPFVLATRLRNRGARAFFRVRLPSPTRAAAAQICQRLRAIGGSCIVLRS